jgi:phosphopantothenoylcysteine decarboxylase/phosphopantothenate--cysteine ligase
MGGDRNAVHIVSAEGVESWPDMDKGDVARRLMDRVAAWLAENTGEA